MNLWICGGQIKSLELPNVKKIGKDFLQNNAILKTLRIPKVEKIGTGFLQNNKSLEILEMPKKLKEEYRKNSFLMLLHRNKQRILGELVVNPSDIASLDKDQELTGSEINSAGVSFNSIGRKKENKEKWKGRKLWYY